MSMGVVNFVVRARARDTDRSIHVHSPARQREREHINKFKSVYLYTSYLAQVARKYTVKSPSSTSSSSASSSSSSSFFAAAPRSELRSSRGWVVCSLAQRPTYVLRAFRNYIPMCLAMAYRWYTSSRCEMKLTLAHFAPM